MDDLSRLNRFILCKHLHLCKYATRKIILNTIFSVFLSKCEFASKVDHEKREEVTLTFLKEVLLIQKQCRQ